MALIPSPISLVIPQLLDPFASEELSLGLELLVGKEGITLLVKEVDATVSRESSMKRAK